jgi:methanogenic corrinoid protein MtbC1
LNESDASMALARTIQARNEAAWSVYHRIAQSIADGAAVIADSSSTTSQQTLAPQSLDATSVYSSALSFASARSQRGQQKRNFKRLVVDTTHNNNNNNNNSSQKHRKTKK